MENYNIGEFAKKIGVSVNTLQRWDRDGILVAKRTPTNRRYYTEEQLKQYSGDSEFSLKEEISKVVMSDKSSDEKISEIKSIIEKE